LGVIPGSRKTIGGGGKIQRQLRAAEKKTTRLGGEDRQIIARPIWLEIGRKRGASRKEESSDHDTMQTEGKLTRDCRQKKASTMSASWRRRLLAKIKKEPTAFTQKGTVRAGSFGAGRGRKRREPATSLRTLQEEEIRVVCTGKLEPRYKNSQELLT